MKSLDLSSWQGVLSSLLSLALFALIGVGIRVLLTMTIQQRRERANRQINERLRTLMAAYKTLGGSFTGNLTVDPTHLREIRRRSIQPGTESGDPAGDPSLPGPTTITSSLRENVPATTNGSTENERGAGSERARRIRDTVEAALSDILLLGTEQQVRLAAKAVAEMVDGRPIHTAELVISLRDFIRKALDLDPIPADVKVPFQGPARPSGSGGGRASSGDRDKGGKGGDGGGGGGNGGASMEGGGGVKLRMRTKTDAEEDKDKEAGH